MSTRPAIALALALAAALCSAGCLGESRTETGPDPAPTAAQAVAAAAHATFSEPTVSAAIAALGEPSPWRGDGLIELGEGRYRLEAEPDRPGETATGLARGGVTVVGLAGEGFENTVLETTGGLLGRGDGERRCWMNPHAPVGFYADPISVEEAVRLTGSIVESMRSEISTARAASDDTIEVELERSAQQPRDDFKEAGRRVWGDRSLIGDLTGPIEIAVAGGRVERLAYELIYRPDANWLPADRSPRRVGIEVTLEPSDETLVLDPPRCQAIE